MSKFEPGQVVECVSAFDATNSRALTLKEKYTVIEYKERGEDKFVSVYDDRGKLIWCDATRFREVDQ